MDPTYTSLSSSKAPGYSTLIAPGLPRPSATNTPNLRLVCKTVLPQNATPTEVGERAAEVGERATEVGERATEVHAMQTLYTYEAPYTLPGLSIFRSPIYNLTGEMP